MTAKRFELIWETDEMCNVFDNDLNVNSTISVEDVVDLLNEQHETIQRLQQNIDELLSVNVEDDLLKENEQLKQQKQQYKGQRDYLLFVIERTCSKELFEETKSYLKEVE